MSVQLTRTTVRFIHESDPDPVNLNPDPQHGTYNHLSFILYVQEVVTLQKKYPNIFASEN